MNLLYSIRLFFTNLFINVKLFEFRPKENNDSNLKFGQRLKAIRKNLKYSQTEMAFVLGIKHKVTISDYENGKTEPSLNTVIKYSALGNVTLQWLITGKEQLALVTTQSTNIKELVSI